MGLTSNSVGINAVHSALKIKKLTREDKIIAVAGNPNVGKSTVFNNLTGLRQHTGNWPGKTVTNTQGYCKAGNKNLILVDIPGTYSLMAHSEEEEVARDFICFGGANAIIAVCDATCIERSLKLVLQILEVTNNVVVCVNLMDEAKKKSINIDIEGLSKKLGVPVIGTIARKKKNLNNLVNATDKICQKQPQLAFKVKYSKEIESAVSLLCPYIELKINEKINSRWLSLKLLDYDENLIESINSYLGINILDDDILNEKIKTAKKLIGDNDDSVKDKIAACTVLNAEDICNDIVSFGNNKYDQKERRIDGILTNKFTGYPIMLLLLAFIFWLTIVGANYPSQLMSNALFWFEDRITDGFNYINAPEWLHGMLVLGVYRVLAWVVSVMLPPMAIFFPIFTVLEDLGYLPRVAFNLDKYFKKCSACGKQALTMCMVCLNL